MYNGFDIFEKETGKITVQRVPPTESKGRRHTSVVVASLFPEYDQIEIKLQEKDLDIQFTKGSGKGGQNRNKRDTAVRIIHKPTGISVFNCEEREQKQNKAKALEILLEKLKELKLKELKQSILDSKINESGRSNKSRTFNFIRGIVIDHLTGNKTHQIDKVMNGYFEWINGS